MLFLYYIPFLGAVLLDLEQNTLPGIAHLVVETMIISDQIKAEDRPSVLRALLLKHRSVCMLTPVFSFNRNHICCTLFRENSWVGIQDGSLSFCH